MTPDAKITINDKGIQELPTLIEQLIVGLDLTPLKTALSGIVSATGTITLTTKRGFTLEIDATP